MRKESIFVIVSLMHPVRARTTPDTRIPIVTETLPPLAKEKGKILVTFGGLVHDVVGKK